jgi:transketolase
MYASARRVQRLVAVVDYNKVQLVGPTAEVLCLEPLSDKWQAFGWLVAECDGHDMSAVVKALDWATVSSRHRPSVVIAHTVKGKGVSFMEGSFEWHGKAPNDDEYERARQELLSP